MSWNIVATLHRKRTALWSRRYKKIDNAIPRIVYHIMQIGQPGDVITLHHAITGLEIGHIRLSVNNVVKMNWSWGTEP